MRWPRPRRAAWAIPRSQVAGAHFPGVLALSAVTEQAGCSDGTPFGAGGSPLGPRFNMRVGVQYTLYNRFDGAGPNFDGTNRNASDNHTLREFLWLAY